VRRAEPGSTRIYSIYFSPDEEELIRSIAALNGTSLSFVVRIAVRQLAAWPAANLAVPPAAVADDART
jgi:hypothetical protein